MNKDSLPLSESTHLSNDKRKNPNPNSEHENQEASGCARCARIDLLNEDQLNAAARLKKNNEDLKVKIEELSQVLSEKLELIKQKKQQQFKREKTPAANDPAKKELEAINKRIFQAQKQLKQLEEKQAMGPAGIKITEMKNEIAEKQGQLLKINKENKLLEDIRTQNAAALAEIEANSETHDLEEEQRQMKTLLKDLKRDNRLIDRETAKQCEYLVTIEQKHKEVCERFGLPASLNPERFDLMQDIISENHKNRQIKQEKQEKETQKKLGNVEVNTQSYKMILSELEKKKSEKQEIELMQKREVEETQARIKQTNSERDQLLLKLRDKEKELNIAIMRINELKRLTKHNALTPLAGGRGAGALGSGSLSGAGAAEFSVALLRRKDIRREQKGISVGTETACSWDSSTDLPETKDYMITKVTIWFKDEYIRGMAFEMKLKAGEKIQVEGFMPSSTEGLEERAINLKGQETITSLIGYYNNLHIEYLRLVTSRGNYVLAGSDKNNAKCKKFEFEIKKDERPISFFGVVDKVNIKRKKEDKSTQQDFEDELVLTSIGLELKKKEQQQSSNVRSNIGLNIANSQVIDTEDAELYGDHSKKTPIKSVGAQKRKVIDALNQKNASVGGDEDEFGIESTNNQQIVEQVNKQNMHSQGVQGNDLAQQQVTGKK